MRQVLDLAQVCLECTDETALNDAIGAFAAFMRFEYILYAYLESWYDSGLTMKFVNLSNPIEWMEEYHQNDYYQADPIRIEVERLLARGETCYTILWDAYDRPLSDPEKNVITRRRYFGLEYGFSSYCNSRAKDAAILLSFASADQKPDEHAMVMGRLIAPHLTRCRKRLALTSLVASLTPRENDICHWLVDGKTNWEIAQILDVSERTIKFHLANIFSKLRVANRQGANAKLLAERYLS